MSTETKTVVVTGAGTGIGEAIAIDLAAAGWRVIATGRREARLRELVSRLRRIADIGHRAERMDVADLDGVAATLTRVDDEYGIDGLVNNAGVSHIHRFLDVTPEKYDELMSINMRGLFFATQCTARLMIASGRRGTVVNIASMASKEGGVPLLADYVGSKFGVLGFTQAAARELGEHGIRVNAVCPGYIRTEMQVREEAWESELTGQPVSDIRGFFESRAALGRVGTAADIAPAVSFLLSEQAGFITGEAVAINGGVYMD